MRHALSIVAIASLFTLATTASAQTTDIADLANDLNTGQAAAGAEVGQPYEAQSFGDWTERCMKAPEGQADPCALYQLLTDSNGAAVAEISVFRLSGDSRAVAGATIVAPLETLLTEALTISVAGSEPRRYPFTFCNQTGCVARVGFTQEEIDIFKAGSAANLRLVPAGSPENAVNLSMSLAGFTAAYDNAVPR